MTQPKIAIPKENLDYIFEALSLMGLICLITLGLYYYGQLPEEIPSHFNGEGVADAYGHKATIFILPGVGLFVFLLFRILEKIPHTFNHAKKITPENAFTQYQLSLRLLRSLSMVIQIGFTFMLWHQIQVALGNNGHLPVSLGIGFVSIIFCTIGFYIFQAYTKNE